ncbi:MAG: T9SS type A sorting domain-containing protein [Flavobacteriales bacterium]|nr:T9SS type A sorting domain-containing protein [Flavobacteriales bacterium]
MHLKVILFTTCLLVTGSLSAQGIIAGEYYWDNDPGTGNGSPIVAVDGTLGQALEQVLAETSALPAPGTHILFLRVRDDNNQWGPAFHTVIEVLSGSLLVPDIQVSQGEFFWDSDPGQGSGSTLLAFDGNYDSALEAIHLETTSLPSPGTHTLGLRVRDVNGNWGPVFRVVTEVLPGSVSFPDIHVSAAEYWADSDPGEGAAMPMLAADGNFDSAVEAVKGGNIPVPVFSGTQVLWMRAQDDDGGWGPPFGVVVNIDTTITGTVAIPELNGNAIRIGPNPTTAAQGFDIRFNDPASFQVRVLDVRGRVLVDRTFNGASTVHVPLDGLASGTYPVGIRIGEQWTWSPVVVH